MMHEGSWATILGLLALSIPPPARADEATAPKVLLYHSFDQGLKKADFTASAVKVTVAGDVALRPDGVRGRAAAFAETAATGQVKIDVASLGLAGSGTLAILGNPRQLRTVDRLGTEPADGA